MDEQSLEDLLALIDLRNITLAAQQRNISQPAYSRRLKAIEDRYSITLVDRSGRPAVPSEELCAMQEELKFALASLKRVIKCFKRGKTFDRTISIAAVHSLSAGALPVAISKIENKFGQLSFNIKSANQDTCFQLLMTEQVSMMLTFETSTQNLQAPLDLVTRTVVTTDRLVPVCTPDLALKIKTITPGAELIPLVGYPPEIFLGRVLYGDILLHSPHIYSKKLVAGMTKVVLSSASSGLGIAWVPLSIIKSELKNKELVIIDDLGFSSVDLTISMLQLRTKRTQDLIPLLSALVVAISETVMS